MWIFLNPYDVGCPVKAISRPYTSLAFGKWHKDTSFTVLNMKMKPIHDSTC